MTDYLNTHKLIKYLLYSVAVLIVIALIVWQFAVYRAAALFNAAMSKQNIFKGVVETESLSCDLAGNISFYNMHWKTDKGETIVNIPKGKIRINPEDMLTLRVNPNTIRELTLEEADLRLFFNDKMKLEFLISKESENAVEEQPNKQEKESNLNLPEQLPNWKIVLKNCRVAAKHRQKIYAMEQVNCILKVSQHQKVAIDFSSGKLGGTMQGDGITLKGETDLKTDACQGQLAIKNVVPRSLGLGKLSDPVTIQGHLAGTTANPTLTGIIKFNTLDLHSMLFTKVSSDFRYNQGIAHFTNTTGSIWGGYVKAKGRYHFDSRRYRIEGIGRDLDLAEATHRDDIEGRGELNFQLLCDPQHRHQVVMGSYEIGKSKFKGLHFKRITGEVFNHNKVTYLKNTKAVTHLLSVTKHLMRVEGSDVDLHPDPPDEAALIGDLEEI